MEKFITLAHGAGGKHTSELIESVFKAHFYNPLFTGDDAAILPIPGEKLAFSTDGFIVSPPDFAGGNIGKLSICGTVNDLACMGAKPMYLSCAMVIEEGLPVEDLKRYVTSMEDTAKEVGVLIVAGDTKVAGKGQVDKLFITTTGIGKVTPGLSLSGTKAKPGDVIMVTGDIGRHGCTILLARNKFGIDAEITSDCAPLWSLVDNMIKETRDIHVIRDATRGGVGTVLYEIAAQSQVGICLKSTAIPVHPSVRGVCGLLGLEPLYLACEGRMVIIVPEAQSMKVLDTLRHSPHGEETAIIGRVTDELVGHVVMETEIGTKTMLPPPRGELLPRIC